MGSALTRSRRVPRHRPEGATLTGVTHGLGRVLVVDDDEVITLDVMMPRLDGWETAVQLRKSPETAHIRVVLITARAQEDDKNRGNRVGADAYLTKPFDPNEMIRVVRELASATPLR